MSLLKHILFLLLIAGIVTIPRAINREVEATASPTSVTCVTEYSGLLNQLAEAPSSVSINQTSKTFCGHFAIDLGYIDDLSSIKIVQSVPFYSNQFRILIDNVMISETFLLPVERMPHPFQPEVILKPPLVVVTC